MLLPPRYLEEMADKVTDKVARGRYLKELKKVLGWAAFEEFKTFIHGLQKAGEATAEDKEALRRFCRCAAALTILEQSYKHWIPKRFRCLRDIVKHEFEMPSLPSPPYRAGKPSKKAKRSSKQQLPPPEGRIAAAAIVSPPTVPLLSPVTVPTPPEQEQAPPTLVESGVPSRAFVPVAMHGTCSIMQHEA